MAEGKRERVILLGKAEEIDLVMPEIRQMMANEGFYIATDISQPNAEIPLVSMNGKIYSMKMDSELAPERFLKTVRLKGPFRA